MFSRRHEGWLVSLTTRGPDGTVAVVAREVALQGVSVDTPQANALVIEVGGRDGHLTHEVRDVATVAIDLTPDRAERALVLESRDRSTTMVAFHSPMRPEEVDGLPLDGR